MNQKKQLIVVFSIILILSLAILILFIGSIRRTEPEGKFRVSISSNPEGATVHIGNEAEFITPGFVYLYTGEYYLWVFKENHYTVEKEILVQEDYELVLELDEVPEELRRDDDFEPQEIDPYPY